RHEKHWVRNRCRKMLWHERSARKAWCPALTKGPLRRPELFPTWQMQPEFSIWSLSVARQAVAWFPMPSYLRDDRGCFSGHALNRELSCSAQQDLLPNTVRSPNSTAWVSWHWL